MSLTDSGPTGPRTEAGKARSSQNSLRNGLFAANDFIREGEFEEYKKTQFSLMNQLTPEGALEETFAVEIVSATWRLRRCRLVEADFSIRTEADPMLTAADESISKDQKSVDRARAQAHGILRRSMAELRKLQSERCLRQQLPFPNVTGLAGARQVNGAVNALEKQSLDNRVNKGLAAVHSVIARTQNKPTLQPKPESSRSVSSFCKPSVASPMPAPASAAPIDSSFCKTAPTPAKTQKTTPRNAICPCRSGKKYKRCCGKDSATPLKMTA